MALVKEVLMCRPTYYCVSYSINPWMVPGSTNREVANRQWENLVNIYRSLGIKINIIDQQKNLPDMVFSADEGIVSKRDIVLSNFRYPERQKERKPYLKWFKNHGYNTNFIPENNFFEGTGECLFFNSKLFIGIGFRAKRKVCEFLSKLFKEKVIILELINPHFYHLDMAFFPLNQNSAFYFPEAFSKKSQEVLKSQVPNLIPFSKEEAHKFASNSFVTDHKVVIGRGLPTFKNTLNKLGYGAIEVDLSEFIKAGGGAHCLTNILSYS